MVLYSVFLFGVGASGDVRLRNGAYTRAARLAWFDS